MEEDDDQGLASPPYPTATTNSTMLYTHVAILRKWLMAEQEALRDLIPDKGREQLKTPGAIASESVWDGVSVLDKYMVLTYLRRIREGWDHVFREHEDSWDSKLALRKRFGILLMAQHILEEAFVDPERREAKIQKEMDRQMKMEKKLQKHFEEMLTPSEQEEEDDEPTDPTQDWWSENDADNEIGDSDG